MALMPSPEPEFVPGLPGALEAWLDEVAPRAQDPAAPHDALMVVDDDTWTVQADNEALRQIAEDALAVLGADRLAVLVTYARLGAAIDGLGPAPVRILETALRQSRRPSRTRHRRQAG